MPSTDIKEADSGDWTPQEARKEFRAGRWPYLSCSRVSLPYIKAGVLAIPSSFADDFEAFCKLNKASCPLLYRSRPGEVTVPPLADDSDVRTDLQLYSLFVNGELRETIQDLSHLPWDDMVSFYMGCSFSFEHALMNAGVAVRHVEKGIEVPVYLSGVRVHPVGPFSGGTIVSMRPMPRDHIPRAVEAVSGMDLTAHGAPIHIGDPSWIGIGNIHTEYYGAENPPYLEPGDVPVFWACNITSGEVWKATKCPQVSLAYSGENVGSLFVSDVRVEDYNATHPPEYGDLMPRVVFISEEPLFASLLSDSALDQLVKLQSSLGNTPSEGENQDGLFINGSLRVSHASCVTIETEINLETNNKRDCAHILVPVLTVIRSALALGKSVVLRTRTQDDDVTWREIIKHNMDEGMISQPIKFETGNHYSRPHENDCEANTEDGLETSVRITVKHTGFTIHKLMLLSSTDREGSGSESDVWLPIAAGEALALALLTLHSCPIHSRYVRKGRGEFKKPELNAEDYQNEELKTKNFWPASQTKGFQGPLVEELLPV